MNQHPRICEIRVQIPLLNTSLDSISTLIIEKPMSTLEQLQQEALTSYRNMFISLLGHDDSTVIQNPSSNHALIIIQELLKKANETAYIQCSNFSSFIYGNEETQNCINEAIQRGIDVRIAIENDKPESEDFFNKLNSGGKTRAKAGSRYIKFDCCIVDKKRYRFEKDAKKCTAIVCASDTSGLARKHADNFAHQWDQQSSGN